jgi:hypothetical protein
MVSVQTVLLIFVLVLFVLIVLAGGGLFLFSFLKTIRELRQSLDKATEILKVLVEGTSVGDVLAALKQAGMTANELGRRTDVLAGTLGMMHKAIFNRGAGEPGPSVESMTGEPGPGDSGFFTSSDAELAQRELVREARKHGIKIGSEAHQPKEEEGVTAADEA